MIPIRLAACRNCCGAVLSLMVLGALGCGGDAGRVTFPEVPEIAFSTDAGEIPESTVRTAMTRVARSVAIALSDASLRQQVLRAIQGSRYREHKVNFKDLVASAGEHVGNDARLLSAMGRAAGVGSHGLRALLDSIVHVEMYLPVKEHFELWQGGGDLIVATALRDHEAPVGFAIGGASVELSAEAPPAVPVLVIVPVEAPFGGGLPILQVTAEDESCEDPFAVLPCDDGGGPGEGSRGTPTEPGVWGKRHHDQRRRGLRRMDHG